MTRDEIKAKLDEAGVEYNKRLGEKKLQTILDAHVQTVQNKIAAEVAEEKPIEEFMANMDRDGDIKSKNGIIIPTEVIVHKKPTVWKFKTVCKTDSCEVFKHTGLKTERFVREYTRSIHGDNFCKLAKQFVDKNNR